MPKVCRSAVAGAGALLLPLLIAGCATGKQEGVVMAPNYHGTWFTIGTSFWWDISATEASLYIASADEQCEKVPTAVITPNRVNVIPSSNGTVTMRRDGEELVATQASGTFRLQQASRSSICRLPSGKYLPGAPFAAR